MSQKYRVKLAINHNNQDIKKGKVIDPEEHEIDEKQLKKLLDSGALVSMKDDGEEEAPPVDEKKPEAPKPPKAPKAPKPPKG